MRLRELMRQEVWQTSSDECLADAAARMRDHGVGSLPVMDGEELVGILTDRDLMHAVADGATAEETRVASYMSSVPIVAAPGDDTATAARLMVQHDVRHLPVLTGHVLVGIVSARDLLVLQGWPCEPAVSR
jgi:CBS domain-containing protein